jgi:hypothetical protein
MLPHLQQSPPGHNLLCICACIHLQGLDRASTTSSSSTSFVFSQAKLSACDTPKVVLPIVPLPGQGGNRNSSSSSSRRHAAGQTQSPVQAQPATPGYHSQLSQIRHAVPTATAPASAGTPPGVNFIPVLQQQIHLKEQRLVEINDLYWLQHQQQQQPRLAASSAAVQSASLAARPAVSTAQLALNTAQMLQAQQQQDSYAGTSSAPGLAASSNPGYADYCQQQQLLLARAAGALRSRRNSFYASLGSVNPFLQQFAPAQPPSNRPMRRCSYSVMSSYEQQLFMQQQGSAGGMLPPGVHHGSSSSLLWQQQQQQQQQQMMPPSYLHEPRCNSVSSMQGAPGAAAAAACAASTEYRPAAAAPRQHRTSWSCSELGYNASGIHSSSSNAGISGQGPQPPLLQRYSGYQACSTYGGMPDVHNSSISAPCLLPGVPYAADSRAGSSSTPRAAAAAAARRVQWAQTQLPLHEEEQAWMTDTPFAATCEGQLAAPEEGDDADNDYEDDSQIETYGAGVWLSKIANLCCRQCARLQHDTCFLL